MMQHKYDLLPPETPIVFADGTQMFAGLANEYRTHDKGYFILAPSGAGKTYFVKSQARPDWLDGDDLWQAANAMPDGEWWRQPLEEIFEVERRCDVITRQAKQLGFWVVGASNRWLKPDAIVIPHWSRHRKWISARQSGDYDGGATTDMLGQVLNHRKEIAAWAKQGVPKFASVQEAASYLASL